MARKLYETFLVLQAVFVICFAAGTRVRRAPDGFSSDVSIFVVFCIGFYGNNRLDI